LWAKILKTLEYTSVLIYLLCLVGIIIIVFLSGCVEYPTPTVRPEATATEVVATGYPTPTQIATPGELLPTATQYCTLGTDDFNDYIVIVSTVVRIRAEPNTNSKILGYLKPNEVISVKCKYEKSDNEVWLLTDNDLWIAQVFNNILLERVK
jgi:hypothetical protein